MKVFKSGDVVIFEFENVSMHFFSSEAKVLHEQLGNVLKVAPQTSNQQAKVRICPHHFELDILNKDDNKTEVLHCCKSLGKL